MDWLESYIEKIELKVGVLMIDYLDWITKGWFRKQVGLRSKQEEGKKEEK